jgi:DNA-binding transcriptional ArsR family regulator
MENKRGLVNLICEYNGALSDPQRVKMMKIMGSNEVNTVSVSEIAKLLGISQPSATKHLQVLYQSDLIVRKRIGTSVFYSLNIPVINQYHQLLDLAFVKGFSPCPYEFKCDECPQTDTCA